MADKYNSIKRLIDLWETFENETLRQDLSEFSEWLSQKIKVNPDLNQKQTGKNIKIDRSYNLMSLKSLPESMRFLEYTSRIAKLNDFYIKKFFADLPINNRLEYIFLHTVSQKESAKKTELINIHLVDYTTGMDIIKRLVNSGMLEEKPDESDKRAKLLIITDKGMSVLNQASKKISYENYMFLAGISTNKWKKTLPVLEEINYFHSEIYQLHNDKTPAELLNLIDSLKHLHR